MGVLSAIAIAYRSIVDRLKRKGVFVGGTGNYPRVEVHSFNEPTPLCKDGSIRVVNCVVESISDKRLDESLAMNEENIRRLVEERMQLDDNCELIGVEIGQQQGMIEQTESKGVLYRMLTNVKIYLENR